MGTSGQNIAPVAGMEAHSTPVPREFEKLLVEFREAQVRFDNEDFSVIARPAGLLEEDMKLEPLGLIELLFTDKWATVAEEDQVVWSMGYVLTMAPPGRKITEIEKVFLDLATRAAANLPGAVQVKLSEFARNGSSPVWWLVFLITQATDASLVTRYETDGFPWFEWLRPFAGSANAIELSGLLDNTWIAQPPLHGSLPATLKARRLKDRSLALAQSATQTADTEFKPQEPEHGQRATPQGESRLPVGKPDEPSRRRCYARDHTWLKWYEAEGETTFHSPAEIRDKWNRENKDQQIDAGSNGRDVVENGIATATKERDSSGGKVKPR